VSAWEVKRNSAAAAREISALLGVPVDTLEDDEYGESILKLSAERYSSELLEIGLLICAGGFEQVGIG
jgi:hypothetical protein